MIVNCTPHEITVLGEEGDVVATLPPSGKVARVSTETRVTGTISINGTSVPLMETGFGEVVDLPEPQDGTWFVVSALVKSAVPDRTDLVVPADQVRDDKGRIVGCRGLSR